MTEPKISSSNGMEATLEKCLDELATIETDFTTLTSDIPEAHLRWSPDSGGWSILHCLAHVNRTTEAYLPNIDTAIERGRHRKIVGNRSSRGTLLGSWLIDSLEPPVKRRFKAPRIFQPPADPDANTMEEFVRIRNEVRQRIVSSSGLDIGRVRLSSPAMKILRVSLGEA
jgi:hypothetical protein